MAGRLFTNRFSTLGKGLLLAASLALPGPAALAHHSLVREYDVNTSIELSGRVSRLDWVNPHIALFLEVEDADGTRQVWECELGSPNPLVQAGWTREDLPVGARITVKANPARDGSTNCSSRNLRLEDGTPVFTLWGVQ